MKSLNKRDESWGEYPKYQIVEKKNNAEQQQESNGDCIHSCMFPTIQKSGPSGGIVFIMYKQIHVVLKQVAVQSMRKEKDIRRFLCAQVKAEQHAQIHVAS